MPGEIVVGTTATLTSRIPDLIVQLDEVTAMLAHELAGAVEFHANQTTPRDTDALAESVAIEDNYLGTGYAEYHVQTHGSAREHNERKGRSGPAEDYTYADYVRRGAGPGVRSPNDYMERAAEAAMGELEIAVEDSFTQFFH